MRIIAGTHKNQVIHAPKGNATRPTSSQLRESLFNICQSQVEDAQFLDLFAGSGAMGLEALSRGAAYSSFVEIGRDGIHCIEKNIKSMGFDKQATIYKNDVFKILHKLIRDKKSFDIIYADPPYDTMTEEKGEPMNFSERVLKLVDQGNLLNDAGLLFIEDAKNVTLEVPLSHLVQIDARRYGRSVLHRYQRVK